MAYVPTPVANTHGITLPSRYTICPLDATLAPWAKALMVQGFLLGPSIWQPLLPEPKIANALRGFTALEGHFAHAINSGLSFAIIDTEYEFQRSESAAAGGCLYWNELNPYEPYFEKNGKDKMIEGMDFPVVCIALSVDAFDKKPDEAAAALYQFMPLVKDLGGYMMARCKECGGQDWTSSSRGELMIRSGCVTKPGYEGKGLMSALNHFVILEAKTRGFKAVTVGTANTSIFRNWMKAPPGCRSRVDALLDIWNIELEDENGRLVKPYRNSDLGKQGWLIWCDLGS